jgi:hypothetical protein
MIKKTLITALFCLFAAAPAIRAQSTPLEAPGEIFQIDLDRTDFDPGLPFSRLVTGRINQDPLADAVLLRGNDAYLLVSPGIFDASIRIPEPVNDIAVLSRTGPDGKDEILLVGPAGLRAYGRTEQLTFTSRDLGSGIWADARLVRVGFIDSRPARDILGVGASGTELLVLANPGTPGEMEASVTLPSVIRDIATYDDDGDGIPRLAVLTEQALLLFAEGGSTIEMIQPVPAPGGTLVVVDQPTPRGRLLWITPTPGGTDRLVLIQDTTLSMPFNLGISGTVAAVAGDINRDGFDDVVVSHKSSWDPLLIINPAGETSPQGPITVSIPVGFSGPASTNEAWPVLLDLDGDHDIDLMYPVQPLQKLTVLQSRAVNHLIRAPALADVRIGYNRPQDSAYLGLSLLNTPGMPRDATHVEIVFYRKTDHTQPTPTVPFFRRLVEVSPDRHYPPFAVPIPETGFSFPTIYLWLQRYVRVTMEDGEPVIAEVFPARMYGFTTQTFFEYGPSLNYLLGLGGSGAITPVLLNQIDGRNVQPGSLSVGTVVEEKPIPDFPEDEEPTLILLMR